MTPKSHPDPPPKRGICDRLENVRESEGLSLKAFWRRLRDEAGLDLTYVAARNYHYNREPPLRYVVAVSKVYDVPVDWLATGKDDPGEETELPELREAISANFLVGFLGGEERAQELAGQDLSFRQYTLQHFQDAWNAVRSRVLAGPISESQEELELARQAGAACTAPLRALDIDPAKVPMDEIGDYMAVMAAAVRIASRLSQEED